jgi:hypothetical protein
MRNAPAVWSVVVGVLAVAALPAAIWYVDRDITIDLIWAGLAIPVAYVLGGLAMILARAGRRRAQMTLLRRAARRPRGSAGCWGSARSSSPGPGRSRSSCTGSLRGAVGRRTSASSALRSTLVFEIGNSLREARVRQGLDLTDVERATKIRPKYLRALEDEQFEILPAQTYVKGFLSTTPSSSASTGSSTSTSTTRATSRARRRCRFARGGATPADGGTGGSSRLSCSSRLRGSRSSSRS